MVISFSLDSDDNQILAIYMQLSDGKVKKTVEVSDGSCYVDVDSKGRPLGIELLAPDEIKLALRQVKKRFRVKGIDSAVKRIQKVLAA
jgi:uncharacterized protein YuzE